MQIARSNIAALCQTYGDKLTLPEGIDGRKLLWALAGNESSFGANVAPRHEDGYCYAGKYYDKQATAAWGCLAHCSFGPWQVMYPNFDKGTSPLLAAISPVVVVEAAVSLIQKHIVGAEQAATLEEIAEAYNSGDWHHKEIKQPVAEYIAKAVKNYALPIGAMA